MTLPIASLDPVTATFILAILVLAAGLFLALAALKSTNTNAGQQAFAAVGVLFGLLAAGGLGGLFANQVAKDSAEQAADQAVSSSTQEVSSQVSELTEQVETALEPEGDKSNGGSPKGNGESQAPAK